MFDTKGLVIYKAKPPTIGKSFVRERDICLGDLNKLRTLFDSKPLVLNGKFRINLSISSFYQADTTRFSGLRRNERTFHFCFWIKDDNIYLLELDGTIDQTIFPCRRIAIELLRVHPAKIFTFPCFGIVVEKVCRRISSPPRPFHQVLW